MGSGASHNTPHTSPKQTSHRAHSSPKPTGLAKPIVVMTKNQRASHMVRTNEVAPVIIKNCREEFQQVVDLTEPLILGRLDKGMLEHPFIMGHCVLTRDSYRCEDNLDTTSQFMAPNVRQARGNYLVFGMGQPSRDGLDLVIDSLHQRKYHWITLFNLRKESVFFVKDGYDMVPYSLRSVNNLSDVFVNSAPGIDAADEEVHMRKQILDFATLNDQNQFFLYKNPDDKLNEPHVVPMQFEDDIQVLEEVFSRKAFASPYLRYKRMCFPAHGPPCIQDFDIFLSVYKECPAYFTSTQENHAIVFCCQTGIRPSTVGMVMACLLEAHKYGSLHAGDVDGKETFSSDNKTDFQKGEFHAIMKLVHVLPDGVRLKHQVDCIIDLCSELHNIRTAIADIKNLLEGITTDYIIEGVSARRYLRERCTAYLDTYFLLICFNAYLTEQYKERLVVSFSVWMRWHPHIIRLNSHLDVSHISVPASLVPQGQRNLVSDDYIGLDVLSSQMDVDVSNFRKVCGFPVYGMAQPHRKGLSKVVSHLMNKKQSHPVVLYVNLRNDMFLECDGSSYNVREDGDLSHSVDLTGVSANKIEMIEEELKHAITDSSESLQVYGDIADPHKEKTFTSVLTMQDLSDLQHEKTSQFVYRRIPMCGETAPDEKTFDSILQLLNNLPEITTDEDGPALLFSCRTGKSRTTTAMTIACLVVCHKRGFPYGAKIGEQERVSVPNAKYTKGDYLIVQSLVRVIPNGQQVKREVDFILDECFETMTPMHFHMREVIFVTYNKIKTAKTAEEETRLKVRSLAFLERYLYLILFNAYLHAERMSNWSNCNFTTWMTEVAAKAGVYDILDNLSFSDFETKPCGYETMTKRWSKYVRATKFHGEFI